MSPTWVISKNDSRGKRERTVRRAIEAKKAGNGVVVLCDSGSLSEKDKEALEAAGILKAKELK